MISLAGIAPDASLLCDAKWHMTVTPSGAWPDPSAMGSLAADRAADWIPATVPGTAAAALEAAGRFARDTPIPLHDSDVWYRCQVEPDAAGPHVLACAGLATICEAWLDGVPILVSDSMYAGHEIRLDLDGPGELVFCFRALDPHLSRKGPRARWRTKLINEPGLRLMRTTLLGHMPGWCPNVHAAGPWRGMALVPAASIAVEDLRIESHLTDDGTGRLAVSFRPGPRFTAPPGEAGASISCAGWDAPLEEAGEGRLAAELLLPGIEAWWPHTHGTPHLHDVGLVLGEARIHLARTGFRRIEVDHGADGKGFGLLVNGVPVFCRGAVWTSADIVALPGDRAACEPWIRLARDANMNMLRIGGTMAPETPAFFELCDEAGILVWQDLPFANFDYPVSDPDFAATVEAETEELLARAQASPSLAVVCGGSEMHQQGAMMGLPETRWRTPLTEEILPRATARMRPDVPYVANSPSGGAMPFSPNEGIAHYYGVGAYRRPLEDARRANVRFAAECLAFSNVPEAGFLPGAESAPGHHPDWKRGVPRDRDVGWDFEDVRDHYVRELYGTDPLDLRHGDPASYLDHGRAAVAEVMEATYAEWRRAGSGCRGALVWTFQDLMPGAGWGVVASDGTPKSAWYALRRAFAPLRVSVTDEGTNGLDIHIVNDGPASRRLRVELACLRDGALPVAGGARDFEIGPHGEAHFAATGLIGGFFDTTHAFRFGPASHDCVHVTLSDPETRARLDEAFHFPLGRAKAARGARVEASVSKAEDGSWELHLTSDRVAQSLAIEDPNFLPRDNWFHLAPGLVRTVTLVPRDPGTDAVPQGSVTTLGGSPVSYSAA